MSCVHWNSEKKNVIEKSPKMPVVVWTGSLTGKCLSLGLVSFTVSNPQQFQNSHSAVNLLDDHKNNR